MDCFKRFLAQIRARCRLISGPPNPSDFRLVLLRTLLALILLVRHNDYLRGVLDLKHHGWVFGAEFGPATLAQAEPALHSPLWPGADALLPYTSELVNVRTALALLLLLGVFPAFNAVLLAGVSLGLLVADSFHYTHHLWVLYTSLALFGLGWLHKIWSFWPTSVTLLRCQVLVIYGAAGLAKLEPSWLFGRELHALFEAGFVRGALVERLAAAFGWGGLASVVGVTELVLPVLLAVPKWRPIGILAALLLHAGIHLTMSVSTFGVTMVVLLLAFLPEMPKRLAADRIPGDGKFAFRSWQPFTIALFLAALSPLGALLAGTRVGSYRMFTALARYELTLRVNGAPISRRVLLPHLGRDGARIVALANGVGIGESHAELLGGALPEVTALLCQVAAQARHVEAWLAFRELTGIPERTMSSRRVCLAAPEALRGRARDRFLGDDVELLACSPGGLRRGGRFDERDALCALLAR